MDGVFLWIGVRFYDFFCVGRFCIFKIIVDIFVCIKIEYYQAWMEFGDKENIFRFQVVCYYFFLVFEVWELGKDVVGGKNDVIGFF